MSEIDALPLLPDSQVSIRERFGIEVEEVRQLTPAARAGAPIDEGYLFDPATTLAILAGFSADRRVLVQGPHGTGGPAILSRSPRG